MERGVRGGRGGARGEGRVFDEVGLGAFLEEEVPNAAKGRRGCVFLARDGGHGARRGRARTGGGCARTRRVRWRGIDAGLAGALALARRAIVRRAGRGARRREAVVLLALAGRGARWARGDGLDGALGRRGRAAGGASRGSGGQSTRLARGPERYHGVVARGALCSSSHDGVGVCTGVHSRPRLEYGVGGTRAQLCTRCALVRATLSRPARYRYRVARARLNDNAMLAWQGATRTKARRGAGPRGGALSLAARWATTKRKLDATDDASEPSPRKRVAVTLEPPSTSLDILDLAVLRRLSDEHGPTHPDHDASSPGGDETTPFEVEPMEADVDHDELLHRPSNKRVRDPADDFLRDPLDADHPSFVFPARGVTAPRSPAPASGAPTAGTPLPPSREEPPAPPPTPRTSPTSTSTSDPPRDPPPTTTSPPPRTSPPLPSTTPRASSSSSSSARSPSTVRRRVFRTTKSAANSTSDRSWTFATAPSPHRTPTFAAAGSMKDVGSTAGHSPSTISPAARARARSRARA